MGAYDKFPFTVVTVSLDEPSILDVKDFNRYQEMKLAEEELEELEEKELLDLLNEVEEELSETQLLKDGKCPACGFEAPLSDEKESQSILICDNCEAGFPGYMYFTTKTTKPEGDET